MGLRDAGFALNYSIPLFSGVRGALEAGLSGGHTTVVSPWAPYVDSPVDAGCDVTAPEDTGIETPTITNPLDGQAMTLPDTITSSAFVTTNGQTHVASRWRIYASDEDGTQGSLIYDSGLDTVNLTSLPVSGLGLTDVAWYLVTVRYKGSDPEVEGGCAPEADMPKFYVPEFGGVWRIPGGPYGQIVCAEFKDAVNNYKAAYIADHPGEDFAPGYPKPGAVSMTIGSSTSTEEAIDHCSDAEIGGWFYSDPQVFPLYLILHGGAPFSGNLSATQADAIQELNNFYYGGASHFTRLDLPSGTLINPGGGVHSADVNVARVLLDGSLTTPGYTVAGRWNAGTQFIHTEVVGHDNVLPLVSKHP